MVLIIATLSCSAGIGLAETNKSVDLEKKLETKLLILREQYQIGMDLYKHEDQLNWTKLYNFFYVNLGLLAIVGLVMKERAKHYGPTFVVALVSVLGFITSLAFTGTIYSGLKCMHNRKDHVVKIEKELIQYGAEDIVSNVKLNKKDMESLDRTLTSKILIIIPPVIAVVWAIVFTVMAYLLWTYKLQRTGLATLEAKRESG
jgi:hypothetical protein